MDSRVEWSAHEITYGEIASWILREKEKQISKISQVFANLLQ